LSLLSILLVVLASLLHASWNLLAKRAAPVGPVFVFAYNLFAMAAYAPLAIYIVMTHGFGTGWLGLAFMVASALIHLAYSLVLQRGYQVADLSVVYPIARGTGPMLSSIAAFLILREMPTARGVSGLALVVSGILLIATQGDFTALRRPGGHAGVRWGTATGGLIASYTVVDAYAVKMLGVGPILLDWFSNTMRFVLLAAMIARNPREALAPMRGHWWVAAAVGLLSPASYILVLTALGKGAPLSIVAPMREMSMMVGALLGMVLLKERVGPWRLVGCALLIVGVVCLSGAHPK